MYWLYLPKATDTFVYLILPQVKSYHNAIFPATPKSSVAVATPRAWNTRLMVCREIGVRPFSSLDICALCTPMRSPSSSWVSFWARRVLRIASPKQYEFNSALSFASIASRLGVPSFPQTSSTTSDSGVNFICAMITCLFVRNIAFLYLLLWQFPWQVFSASSSQCHAWQ